jgi:predicted enzyme related to lactoylglutathione lyase
MAEENKPKPGTIGWHDLTVPDADNVRDFYVQVAGLKAEPLDMGGYSDYMMMSPTGEAVGGVCHQRGVNSDIPPVWLVYLVVEDLDASVAKCTEMGGKILKAPTGGTHNYSVIQDPAGAICALYQA